MTCNDDELAAYIEARRLNGTLPDDYPLWRYVGGWYRIGHSRYRTHQLRQLTANLRERLPQPPEVTE